MELLLDRRWKKETYTIGNLYINGIKFCETVEDKDRGLRSVDPLSRIQAVKVPGETAIPTGKYTVLMDVVSPKYSAVAYYKQLCGGKMPRLRGVPGWEGVLIHPGSSALDSAGCILPGRNKVKGGVIQSRDTFKALYAKLLDAHKKGETITIEIK